MGSGSRWRGPVLVVAALALLLSVPLLFGDRVGPAVIWLETADVVAQVEAQGRRSITVPGPPPYELDVLALDVAGQTPVVADAPVPPLEATVDVTVLEDASWWERGAEEGELVVFLDHRPRSAGPPWTLVFAVDARTGDITGEFDDGESREAYRAVAANARARTPEERVDALVAWVRELATPPG